METPSSPSPASARGDAAPGADWQPSEGIIDRMAAYRDWWNIPARRGRPARASRDESRPHPRSARP